MGGEKHTSLSANLPPDYQSCVEVKNTMGTKGVFVVVLAEDNRKVLLHRREDFRIWALPGGRVENDESWKEAGVREVFEETGYQIEIERLVGEYSRPQMPGGGDISHVCVGRVIGGAPIQSGPETLEVKWFPLDALPPSLHRFMDDEYIQDALTDTSIPFKKTQHMPIRLVFLIHVLLGLRSLRNRLIGRS